MRVARRRDVAAFDRGDRTIQSVPVPAPLAPAVRQVTSVVCADTPDRVFTLTYDDGPDPRQTPALLDLLAERGTRATFFLLTGPARRHPEIVRRMRAEGHEVGLHGIDHTRITTLSTAQVRERLRRGMAELQEITGERVRYYRPAYGAQTVQQVVAARRLGLLPMLWSGWASDWEDTSVATAVDRAAAAVHPGCVLLLHDAVGDPDPERPEPQYLQRELTAGLLDRVGADYRVVPLPELLEHRQVHSFWFNAAEKAS